MKGGQLVSLLAAVAIADAAGVRAPAFQSLAIQAKLLSSSLSVRYTSCMLE